MNRRFFIHQPITFVAAKISTPPRMMIFESNNKRMTAKIAFIDQNQQVLMITEKIWYDAITNDVRTDSLHEMFILESDEL